MARGLESLLIPGSLGAPQEKRRLTTEEALRGYLGIEPEAPEDPAARVLREGSALGDRLAETYTPPPPRRPEPRYDPMATGLQKYGGGAQPAGALNPLSTADRATLEDAYGAGRLGGGGLLPEPEGGAAYAADLPPAIERDEPPVRDRDEGTPPSEEPPQPGLSDERRKLAMDYALRKRRLTGMKNIAEGLGSIPAYVPADYMLRTGYQGPQMIAEDTRVELGDTEDFERGSELAAFAEELGLGQGLRGRRVRGTVLEKMMPVLAQLAARRADAETEAAPDPLSDAQAKQLASVREAREALEDVLARKKKFDTGPIAAATDWALRKTGAGDYIGDHPEKEAWASSINDALMKYVVGLSGAQFSHREFAEHKKTFPSTADNDQGFTKKAREAIARLERQERVLLDTWGGQGKDVESMAGGESVRFRVQGQPGTHRTSRAELERIRAENPDAVIEEFP